MIAGMRRQHPQHMARWLARRNEHGWSWVELSRRSGHPAWKLRWWQGRLERNPVQQLPARAFVAVEISRPERPSTGAVTITTPSGYRIEVASDINGEQLRRVVEALEQRC